ncbi:MAG: glycoside hydrolase family 130 protein [Planctomycetota bacterium]
MPQATPTFGTPPFPWQDRSAHHEHDIIWRYSGNPIIRRDQLPTSNSIFNSAVVPFGNRLAGVFRCDDRARKQCLHVGFSDDGFNWELRPDEIDFRRQSPDAHYHAGYDPRVVFIEDRYWVQWCNLDYGPSIGLAWTQDFESFHQIDNAFLPFNRNGVLFPRKIDGHYAMLSRPSDNGHTPFGDIWLSRSPDLTFWGKHRWVMRPEGGWQSTKVGAGPTPIETDDGWLLIYHGVNTSCNGMVYSFGAALLDHDEPWNVTARARDYLMCPRELYECVGDVPNVVFPCATLTDANRERLAIYYGAADTVTGLAFGFLPEILDWVKRTSTI